MCQATKYLVISIVGRCLKGEVALIKYLLCARPCAWRLTRVLSLARALLCRRSVLGAGNQRTELSTTQSSSRKYTQASEGFHCKLPLSL